VTWELVIGFKWPQPDVSSTHARPLDLEALIRECVDPLHRENIIVTGVRIEQVPEQ